MDFCTWRGLLVISGTKPDAQPDGQYFRSPDGAGLWCGAIDDLWKFGKPVGRADRGATRPSRRAGTPSRT